VTAICDDGVLDGTETDVDCGGACAFCPLGASCRVDQDCASEACDGQTQLCVADQCHDHRQDGMESDIDCGRTCALCPLGQKCKLDWDCASNTCDAGLCHVPYCVDGVKDWNETDVDCGGGQCPGCGVGQACIATYDCQSQACDAITHTCVTDHCFDHNRDGDETDLDCGGPTCAMRCAIGRFCQTSSDCVAGLSCAKGFPHLCE
jgi:hypothetical protein